ncbi:MAG: hypothetical protein EAZ85_14875 [Bacteroidetes bacterium]|nr:MAG: hypothetical protein EAZ85_14875 [Bacteroidota bacterium]TAG85526.1 MAG: hypothetical protein EAZ20_14875 [Bacteroidota bacterium]
MSQLVQKIIIFIGIFFISIWNVSAQSKTDSLLRYARMYAEKTDYSNALRSFLQAIKIEEKNNQPEKLASIYQEISDVYSEGNLNEKALEYLKKAEKILPEDDDITSKIGDMEMKQRNYKNGLNQYLKIFNEFETKYKKEPIKKLPNLRKIIIAYQNLKEYDNALKYNFKILEIQNELKNEEGILIAKNNIGYNYKYLKNYKQAIQVFEEILAIEKKQNKNGNVATLINLGITYQNIGDYQNTLKYLLEANTNIEKKENKKEMAQMYDLLSSVYFNLKDYYNAKYYNDLALKLSEESKDKKTLSNAYQTTSLLYQQEEKYDKALEFFKNHLRIKDSLLVEERMQQQNILQQQYVVERSENESKLMMASEEIKEAQLKEARAEADKKEKENQILQQNQKIKDEQLARQSLEQKRAKQELLLLQQQSLAEKKDRAILELQRSQAIKDAEISKRSALEKQKEQERKNEIELLNKDKKLKEIENQRKESESKQFQNFVMVAFALGSLVFGLVLFGLITTGRKNRKLAKQQEEIEQKNIELAQNNEEIATQRDSAEKLGELLVEKNQHIISSINYAKQIQESILPLSEDITKVLPEHFILFKPRDIVSGDFYFFAHKDNKTVIAAIDCTGHGVPGALMSMVGNQILNEIIVISEIYSPDLILNELHKGIRKALKQEETTNRDGMDMSLITIYHQEKKVEFAGAKNPLIYVQNNELVHLKGDKNAIGGEQREENRIFTKHTISTENKTYFYLFSDGYQDQFGGKERKKFMIKKMKELLFDIHKKDMITQKEILKHEIEIWINESTEPQTDDILVIGIKI